MELSYQKKEASSKPVAEVLIERAQRFKRNTLTQSKHK